MRSPALALALALACALSASPAAAYFRITTVACDTVSTSPLMVRTTFNLDLVGPGGYCFFFVFPRPAGPAPADTTHFYSAGAPSGWVVAGLGTNGVPFEFFRTGQNCFGSGDHFAGFTVIANRPGPCAHFIFDNGLLFAEDQAVGDGCMILDGPVPANATSWGQLKAIYRR